VDAELGTLPWRSPAFGFRRVISASLARTQVEYQGSDEHNSGCRPTHDAKVQGNGEFSHTEGLADMTISIAMGALQRCHLRWQTNIARG
jgi:hypothetical protein